MVRQGGGWRGWGVERGYIRRLHMLADLKSRQDLTAYLVREEPNPKADCWSGLSYKHDRGDVSLP